jgi:Tfp pilus assembly protein PilX
MTANDIDRRLVQETAEAMLEHAAEQFAAVASLVRSGDASQEQLRAARRRLQAAAGAWCEAYGHAAAP